MYAKTKIPVYIYVTINNNTLFRNKIKSLHAKACILLKIDGVKIKFFEYFIRLR